MGDIDAGPTHLNRDLLLRALLMRGRVERGVHLERSVLFLRLTLQVVLHDGRLGDVELGGPVR